MSDPLENLVANMTLADLARSSGRSVAEIVGFAMGGPAKAASVRPTNGTAQPKRTRRVAKAATRTASGRGDFDAGVLEAIRAAGGPVRSVDLEGKVGGTPEQRRAALHRLVAGKKIKRAGAARGTTYEARG